MTPALRRAHFRVTPELIYLETVWFLSYRDILIMQDFMFAGRRAVSRRLCLPLYFLGVRFFFVIDNTSLLPRKLYVRGDRKSRRHFFREKNRKALLVLSCFFSAPLIRGLILGQCIFDIGFAGAAFLRGGVP